MSLEAGATSPSTPEPCTFSVDHDSAESLVLRLSGTWTLAGGIPRFGEAQKNIEPWIEGRKISFEAGDLTDWDSGCLTFLFQLANYGAEHEVEVDWSGLPTGVQRLTQLAIAVPERPGARRGEDREPFLSKLGKQSLELVKSFGEMLGFLGQATQTFGRYFRGQARFRRSDFVLIIEDCGANALPIVTLISLLVGMILAFVGAVQLEQFGAGIYVANLVGIAMVREMGAMMTGIIMAGRTGAAFAAQLGTMQVNEEVDALSTLGLSAMDFLVLPRMLALILMMPLLCVYADLMGILGGAIVGIGMLDLTLVEYLRQTQSSIGMTDFALGVGKSAVFGVLIAISGCMRGIACGRSASGVGLAATSAVVTGIVFIIVTDGIFAVVTNAMGI
jgi:phospholipid/cholesterol/gamma-HCH transport system permease protein